VEKQVSPPKRIETRTISDADVPPTSCPKCQSKELTRYSYYFRDLQELGSPTVDRRVRYEAVTWLCKVCQTTFLLHNPIIPPRSPFMPEIVEYVRHRILTKGDSAGRVVEDLKTLHQVDVAADTILSWINPTKETLDAGDIVIEPLGPLPSTEFSGVLGLDGTFKAVKEKKKNRSRARTSRSYCI
jgi:hypothetical protein